MPAGALSRAGARVVESGAEGRAVLGDDAWERLRALPDPRSPRGRVYQLAGLVAIAVCAFTVAGHDRLAAVGQWIKRASPADLASFGLPWDPFTGAFRVPDEKTVRTVLDRLDPQALSRALLGGRHAHRSHRRRPDGAPSRSVRDYRARRATAAAKALARNRIRAVAVDGKTSRGARRKDGTRVHLLGVLAHGGPLLDHLEVNAKHNEVTHFTTLLAHLDLEGVTVTFDALHTVRDNLKWLVTTKNAHYIAVIKKNQCATRRSDTSPPKTGQTRREVCWVRPPQRPQHRRNLWCGISRICPALSDGRKHQLAEQAPLDHGTVNDVHPGSQAPMPALGHATPLPNHRHYPTWETAVP